MRELRDAFRIPAAHPALPGHFPDQPVVPGVVLLDRVAALIERDAQRTIVGLPSVKFLAPLLPEQDAAIVVTIDDARARFRIERDGAPIASGEANLA